MDIRFLRVLYLLAVYKLYLLYQVHSTSLGLGIMLTLGIVGCLEFAITAMSKSKEDK